MSATKATPAAELTAARQELIEAIIKTQWELKAFREILDQVTVEHIPVLRDQSTRIQKLCNSIHTENANLIINLTKIPENDN